MNSLLKKVEEAGITNFVPSTFKNGSEYGVLLEVLQLPNVLKKAYQDKSLNEVCEYLFRLTSSYNKFYAENRVLNEENIGIRDTWLALTEVVRNINLMLLDVLAIKVPEKM